MSNDKIKLHWIISTGWVHTHGMDALGLPELEVRHVPGFLAEPAARLLKEVCLYMRETGKIVRAGETMCVSERTRFQFVAPEPMPGEEDHYATERLQIVDIEPICDCCRLRLSEQN
jgi:hypothetical protein